jgi:hypothetical protein
VIFVALARGQELIVFILITGSMLVYGLGSREDALSIQGGSRESMGTVDVCWDGLP